MTSSWTVSVTRPPSSRCHTPPASQTSVILQGSAHRGILAGAERILELARPSLETALTLQPSYRLLLTGHSLGAGTASLLALALTHGPAPLAAQVTCLALAPPPVYSGPLPPGTETNILALVNRCCPCSCSCS